MVLARPVDKATARHAMRAAGVQVADQLDNHQVVMLLTYLGLQIHAVAGVGSAQELFAVSVQRRRQFVVRRVDGHFQQALFDQGVQLRVGGKVHRLNVDQRAVIALAARFDLLGGIGRERQRFGLKSTLASTQREGNASQGSQF